MATAPNSDLQASHPVDSRSSTTGRSGETDYRLVTRIVHRDEGAFGAIYDRYSRVVYSVALRVVRDAGIAEDILHDIFLNLWRSPQQFDGARGKLAPWLAVIARNRAIDWIRKQRLQEDLSEVQLVADEDMAGEVERKFAIERVRLALNALPEKQRVALELAFFQGLTHADIAAQAGEPLGTVKTRIRSALLAVRRALEQR
jgi:RNA polymerase sigma-70 factor (ECF subfamily)